MMAWITSDPHYVPTRNLDIEMAISAMYMEDALFLGFVEPMILPLVVVCFYVFLASHHLLAQHGVPFDCYNTTKCFPSRGFNFVVIVAAKLIIIW